MWDIIGERESFLMYINCRLLRFYLVPEKAGSEKVLEDMFEI